MLHITPEMSNIAMLIATVWFLLAGLVAKTRVQRKNGKLKTIWLKNAAEVAKAEEAKKPPYRGGLRGRIIAMLVWCGPTFSLIFFGLIYYCDSFLLRACHGDDAHYAMFYLSMGTMWFLLPSLILFYRRIKEILLAESK
jgi:hypothetical protein